MRLADLGPDAVFYRFLTPKFAHQPTSGAGAALRGGRFNRRGVQALYLARSPHTAIEEYTRGDPIAPPGTLAPYRVTASGVIDLSGGFDPATWPADWADWDCDWKTISRIAKAEPPSWRLADAAIAEGRPGILYPSKRDPGGVNLVLFTANLKGPEVVVHDPTGALPKDQSSWSKP